MGRDLGPLIVAAGVAIVVVGLLVWSGALGWFGRLPGDIRYESGSSRVWIPITSSIIASIVLTIVINLVLRLLR